MGLIKRIFGAGGGADTPANSRKSGFGDSVTTTEGTARNAPRRELVQVVLRDTMRKHGIPSDWIDCRILSVLTQRRRSGMHVQFLVRQGDRQLLPYLHAFQASFWQEMGKFEPKAHQWLFSLGWEFQTTSTQDFSAMPGPEAWHNSTQPSEGDTVPELDETEAMQADLRALQAALRQRQP